MKARGTGGRPGPPGLSYMWYGPGGDVASFGGTWQGAAGSGRCGNGVS